MSAELFALERVAFAAWPALETYDIGSWHLRFANGYTKRANSANLLKHTAQLSSDTLRDIETEYRKRNLPPIFRLASFTTDLAVDHLLTDRGYRLNDVTLVQTQSLNNKVFTGVGEVSDGALSVDLLSVEQWFEAFQNISGKVGAGQATHLKMLQAIRGECAFAVLKQEGEAVCCGLAVVSAGYCGLFDIATAAPARGQGLATRLCADLLVWSQQRGAETAYLQVTAHNLVAINVYEKLGFRRAYEYWYRVGSR